MKNVASVDVRKVGYMSVTEKGKHIFQDVLDVIAIGAPREQQVIKFRLGIPNDREFTQLERNLPIDEVQNYIQCNPHTLEETEKEFGLTRARIRQIEGKIFRRHSCFTRSKKLKDYLE